MSEHAVIVHFQYGSTDFSALFELSDKLESAIDDAQAGEFDGHEIATDGSDGYLYMYGPDADALYSAIESSLEETSFMKGAEIRKRYGPPEDGVKESIVVIGA